MNLNIFKSIPELNEKLIAYVIEIANQAIESKGSFNFVLTGGNSPKELYRQLATTYKNEIDWTKVYFFFGDERTVLPNHKDYNGLMAKENLFAYLQTPASHIFYMDTTLQPEAAAIAYKNALDQHFKDQPIVFDLVLLGMGDDAHTASIFPGTDLVQNKEETVAAVWVEKLNTYRISLTAPLINKAKNIAFITFGDNKAIALAKVLASDQKDPNTYPAQLINPINGNLAWFVDEQAASLL
ncbi:6-phosphogluconolactonase [Pedobacter insulae]|uniref:6-phosphogluconolactonase n=1 Tax=Pedobacter insulae TaxID=414048 RepID=A0A1I3ADS3_9SPHI|nr:6-phosphogluconolactonase [Pedobacter insulae]SFH47956.1 6-phosphogluconolactonase [Pedobacter insulae]